jgi:hypothetical protein
MPCFSPLDCSQSGSSPRPLFQQRGSLPHPWDKGSLWLAPFEDDSRHHGIAACCSGVCLALWIRVRQSSDNNPGRKQLILPKPRCDRSCRSVLNTAMIVLMLRIDSIDLGFALIPQQASTRLVDYRNNAEWDGLSWMCPHAPCLLAATDQCNLSERVSHCIFCACQKIDLSPLAACRKTQPFICLLFAGRDMSGTSEMQTLPTTSRTQGPFS